MADNNNPINNLLLFMLLSIPVLLSNTAFAQLILNAELRPRTEVRHGYATLADKESRAAVFTSQRSRLSLLFNQENYRIGYVLQDVRVWGDEAQLQDTPSVAAHEMWGEIDFTSNLHLKVGRQELVYDDHRLLGNVNWAQQARSHDAVLLKTQSEKWQAHIGAAYNNEKEQLFRTPYTQNNYRSLFFLWSKFKPSKEFNISTLAIADGFQGADIAVDETIYRYTAGTHAQLESGKTNFTGTFYYQFGTDVSNKDISAYMFALNAMYKYRKTNFEVGLDYLSGTDLSEKDKMKTFNTLYATNHKFYGWMDYFLNIPLHTAQGGLSDLYLGIQHKFSPKTSLTAKVHQFSLVADIFPENSPEADLGKKLGTEIDTNINYKFSKDVSFQAGFSMMFAEELMAVLKGGDNDTAQYWGWLMIRINPEILKLPLTNP
jgi:hypothetical protein